MFELAEVDLSRVYIFDGSPLTDVTRVGKHKAVGYVNFSATEAERHPPPLVNLREVGEMLESRGMKVYYDGAPSGRGHQQEIAELVQKLPQVLYDRKLRPAHFYLGENRLRHALLAADPVTIEKLLLLNRRVLYGFPPTVDAFVDLIRTVWIDERSPLGELIRLAFLHYRLYGGREIPRILESDQPADLDLSMKIDAENQRRQELEAEVLKLTQQLIKVREETAEIQREIEELRALQKRQEADLKTGS
jgi:hypothetical protein